MTRAQIEARIAELKVENEKAPGGAGTNARAELIRELEAQLPCSAGSAGLDVPPERYRTDEQRKDIQRAWDIVGMVTDGHLLNSTEGHLAVLRGIQMGRRLSVDDAQGSSEHLRALHELIVASEDDYCSDDTEKGEFRESDEEPVAAGVGHVSSVTFGMVRRAREAIDALSQPSPAATVGPKSAPDFVAPQNNAERPPSSDAVDSGADTRLSAASEGQRRQYYYRMNGCNAAHSQAPDCVCWHDEGTGPYADRSDAPVTWRTLNEPQGALNNLRLQWQAKVLTFSNAAQEAKRVDDGHEYDLAIAIRDAYRNCEKELIAALALSRPEHL